MPAGQDVCIGLPEPHKNVMEIGTRPAGPGLTRDQVGGHARITDKMSIVVDNRLPTQSYFVVATRARRRIARQVTHERLRAEGAVKLEDVSLGAALPSNQVCGIASIRNVSAVGVNRGAVRVVVAGLGRGTTDAAYKGHRTGGTI